LIGEPTSLLYKPGKFKLQLLQLGIQTVMRHWLLEQGLDAMGGGRFFVGDRPPSIAAWECVGQPWLSLRLSCLIAYAEMSSANLNRNRINYKIRPKWCLHTIEYSFSADVDTSHGLYFLFFKLVEP
jgi:hypothetical protein